METTQIRIFLDRQEAEALARAAQTDYRQVHSQARFLIREALRQKGLLQDPGQATSRAEQEKADEQHVA